MPKNLWLKKFNPDDDFKWRRTVGDCKPGDKVVKKDFLPRRLKQLYESRMIVAADVWNEFVGRADKKRRVVEDSAPVSDAPRLPSLPGLSDGVA